MKNLHNSCADIGILLLAAGASRRMGTPKQLLKIGAKTLIERTINCAKSINNAPIVVVLGANAEKIKPFIEQDKALFIVLNPTWQQGMGTSLKKGITYFLEQPQKIEAVIVLVCDQPYLTTTILEALISKYRNTEAAIIASRYADIIGVPALFSKKLFSKLVNLNADMGARKLINNYAEKKEIIDFPKGIIDLDTPTAYELFLKNEVGKEEKEV